MSQLDEIRMQVMWNRLISVVEEQAMTLLRTAFSTSVREAGDLSAGVYNAQGEMLAQAVTGTPGHVNTMAEAVLHFIAEIPREDMYPGDTYVTNDPWKGTGHLHDITMVSPSFNGEELIGFFACTAHVVDVGGRGFGADGKSVYEEGIQIPIMKFAKHGEVNKDLLRILRPHALRELHAFRPGIERHVEMVLPGQAVPRSILQHGAHHAAQRVLGQDIVTDVVDGHGWR